MQGWWKLTISWQVIQEYYLTVVSKISFLFSLLEFCSVTSTIRSATRSLKLTLPGEKIIENVLPKLNSSKKSSQAACKLLIDEKCTRPEKSQKKWIRDCEVVDVEKLDWESVYLLPKICTLSTKLRNIQFKFLQTLFYLKINFRNQIFVAFVKHHKKRCFISSGNAQSQEPFGIMVNSFSSRLI